MKNDPKNIEYSSADETRRRRLVAQHLQEIEGNPLDAEEIAMFEMFEREGWPHEKRRTHILERAHTASLIPTVE